MSDQRCPRCWSKDKAKRGTICAQGTCMANANRENKSCGSCRLEIKCDHDWHGEEQP